MKTHVDLFSGIGGFALACRWLGIETIAFSEIDPYCCRVLKKNFPGVLNYGDVRTFPTLDCDLITGGFPCQPFSLAGKRRGADDNRYLWPAMLDVITRCRPAWVLGENVPGLIGMELDRVCADLEGLKFRVQPLVIPACAVDAPHRRERVWIVAYAERGLCDGRPDQQIGQTQGRVAADGCSETLAHAECRSGNSRPDGMGRQAGSIPCGGSAGATLANPASPRRDNAGQHGSGRTPLPARPEQCGEVLVQPNSAGFGISGALHAGSGEQGEGERDNRTTDGPSWWPVEPQLGRVAHGIPNRVDRLRGLGNAIVPQVAAQILKAMIEADSALSREPGLGK